MLVRDFMTPNPKTLRLTDTLKDAAFLFYKYKIGGAPVVNDKHEVCGLVTKEHIIEANLHSVALSQPVSVKMNQGVIVVQPECTLDEAWQIPVSLLPVVDHNNQLVGIISRQDFMGIFYANMCRASNEVQALVRSAHNGIIVINSYGIIEVFNEAAGRLVGIAANEARGKFIYDVIPNTRLMHVLQTGECEIKSAIEIADHKLTVNRSPICEGSKVVGALAIIEDTSQSTDTTQKLATTQQKLEALECIFESLKQGIIVVDNNNVIHLVNHSYEDIMGIPREEMLGQTAKDMIENSRMHVVLKTGVPELAELQSVKGRTVVVHRIPMFKDGEIIGAVGEAVFKDISEVDALLQREKIFVCTKPAKQIIKDQVPLKTTFESIIGRSRPIVHVKNLAARAAATDSTVLITGESGTGKDLFAQAIHNASWRSSKPMVSINCAAIPTELLEAELFGYDEGAFTGAKRGGKKGKFELAEGGTLFLDEIGDMPLPMQAKLLRVMQDKTFEHIGGEKVKTCDVRIIAATNKPLEEMVQSGAFREDLYYRLNVICLEVPPLRDRKEDIGELIEFLIPGICHRLRVPVKQFSPEALAILRSYPWPGNVRELINTLEQIGATISVALITSKHLPPMVIHQLGRRKAKSETNHDQTGREKDYISDALKNSKGNKALAAKILGIHRSTLYEKIKKYNL
ncbi:Anaerobic nitric oxide reductase transcription regulator NorR [bioreactor metagenome]|uniref:Anaerobic nitric oxide reductase transcription regulator NorR n=1 Tax=bioreactor metagenome TaxID=1076179 RepID=A0A644TT16_9ZZZZ|nr:sigma 54-interacting transcriptional regulator [Negativicutes bacterium]